MSDIVFPRNLSEIGKLGTSRGSAAAGALATVSNLPSALSTASAGALIKGTVIESEGRGAFLLRTDNGTLTLHTSLALKVGNEVVAQLQSLGTQTRVLILSVNNTPLASIGRGTAAAVADQAPAAPLPPERPDAPSAPATGERARPAPDATARPASRGPAPAGPPAGSEASRGPSETPAAVSTGRGEQTRGPLMPGLVVPARLESASSAGTSAAPRESPAGPGLRAGDTFTVRVLAVGAAGTPAPGPQVPPHAAEARQLTGTVVAAGSPDTGSPAERAASPAATVISTPAGRLVVPAPPPGPEGTAVRLEILGSLPARDHAENSALDSRRAFLRLSADWPALKETIGTLAASPASDGGPPAPLPQPGARLASAMLFFISALKGGDVRAWLGQTADRLDAANRPELLTRLGEDFARLGRVAADPQPGGWQAMLVPLVTDDRVEQIRMFFRRNAPKGGKSDDGTATRFVVEAELSRFGLFQLDGLVRARQFDLVVRTGTVLSGDMQMAIRGIFTEALDTGDLAGSVKFDSGEVAPFNPLGSDALPDGRSDGVVV